MAGESGCRLVRLAGGRRWGHVHACHLQHTPFVFRQARAISLQREDLYSEPPENLDTDSHSSMLGDSCKKGPKPLADFLLGLSVRQHLTGYALLRFADLQPLQFGLIDVRKTLELQQKALEISAVLRDLRKGAPQKLMRFASDTADEGTESKKWRWVVSIDDSTVDRSPPRQAKQQHAHRAVAMLQGLVIGDTKRLFRAAPALVNPRQSRRMIGVHGLGIDARKDIFEIAVARVADFPVIKRSNGIVNEDSYLMSDAWAAARYSQRAALVAEKQADQQLVQSLRKQALASKRIQRMQQAVADLLPRKAGKELAIVIESRVQKYVRDRIQSMLEVEQERGEEIDATPEGASLVSTKDAAWT